ncbi:MAG: hypothetical protein EPN88_17240 [Bacteroidetes bacterium]|nr:MAG: hypothetical protein EPN88_17240 [Bacteroidota bacterium]
MNNDTKIKLLKIAFWIGAITDALAAIIMIFPQLRTYIFGSDNFSITSEYRYALGLGASLMVGWTILLIWGSFKPLERRGLLIITVFPVITGIVIAQIYAVCSGYIHLTKIFPIWIHLSLVSAFYIYSFIKTKENI